MELMQQRSCQEGKLLVYRGCVRREAAAAEETDWMNYFSPMGY